MSQHRIPIILNFDDAIRGIPNALDIPLEEWQEKIRFGCKWTQFRELQEYIFPLLPEYYGCVFTGSGDYHHLSHLLLQRLNNQEKIRLIICDNHPDNMRYPFGIHCGSWVYWASRLPWITQIHVIGIGSADISLKHAWENHWAPLFNGKLTYWSCGSNANWLNWFGKSRANREFITPDMLMSVFLEESDKSDLPIYLSIDKDVLSETVVNTNWDQGSFLEKHLDQLIEHCAGKLIGADITGEVSVYHYQSRFKRVLSTADGQQPPEKHIIQQWQYQQNALNLRLLDKLGCSWRA